MLNTNNFSVTKFSWWIATIAVLCTGIGLLLNNYIQWQLALLLMLLILLIVFSLCKWLLQIFVENRIKLLYKMISSTRTDPRNSNLLELSRSNTSLHELTKDVLQWATFQNAEIEQLKETENYRKDFLMNFSHEIKTPIFTLQGYLDTLNDGAIENPNLRQKFLNNALKSANRLSSLVEDIDELAKIETGTITLKKENILLEETIHSCFDEMQLSADNKQVKFILENNVDSNLKVNVDVKKIKQVFLNIISNAIRYGKTQNGIIKVSISSLTNEKVYIEITDNGVGIAEEHVARVFERFYRTDEGRARHAGGSGLGLSIVKHLLELHGTAISCRSKIGVGTTFSFNLFRA